MKLTFCVILIFISFPFYSFSEDSFIASAGIGQRLTNWLSWPKSWERTDYDVDTAMNTIVTGDFTIPKISTKIGFNLQQDSKELSKINQFAGYLGFNALTVKAEKGKFAGSVFFDGPVVSGDSQTITYNQEFFYAEITFNVMSIMPENAPIDLFYMGFRYTKWNLPSEIYLVQESRTFTVMDPTFESSFYSFVLGEDSFTSNLLYNKSAWKPGLGLMKSFVLGVGYGTCKISKKAFNDAKTLYSLEMTDQEYPILAGHVSGQIGPMYSNSLFGMQYSIGLGIDLNFLFLGKSPFTSEDSAFGNAPANDSGKAYASTYPMFLYYGPILRFHGVF